MSFFLALVVPEAAAQSTDDPAASGAPAGSEEDRAEEVVVVTGTRTPRRLGEAPVAVEVVDREAIEASGAEDVADVLDQHPGVNVARGVFGATVRLRGLNAEHTLILVDGQRVIGRKDGTFDLSRIPIDSIERIEIVKGASSALYGSDAMGGVINIITRRSGRGRTGMLHARGGTLATADGAVGFGTRKGRVGLRVDAGYHRNGALDLDPSRDDTDLRGLEQVTLSGSVELAASDAVELRGFGSYALQDAQGVDLGVRGALFDARNVTEDGVGRFVAGWEVSPRTTWTQSVGLSVYRDQFVNDQREASALDEYQDTRETLLQLTSQLEHDQGAHRLTLGAEGFLASLVTPRLDEGRGQRQIGAVYGQDEWRLGRLLVVPGLRLDADSWFGTALAPKLGLRADPADTLTVRASAGYGWRAPAFRELLLSFDNSGVGYRVDGNPDLQPERSLGATAGLEWAPTAALSLALSGWYDRLTNLIQIATLDEQPGLVQFGYANVARARSRGLEAAVALDPITWFAVDLSFTLTDAVDLDQDRPLEGRPPLQGTARLHFRVPVRQGPRLTARAGVFGPRPFYVGAVQAGLAPPGTGDRVDASPYALVDLRLMQPIGADLELFGGVENLLDAGDPQFLQVPPRFLYAGVNARLPSRR